MEPAPVRFSTTVAGFPGICLVNCGATSLPHMSWALPAGYPTIILMVLP